MIHLGRFFLQGNVVKELFWTDRKQGGRLYHLFSMGVYDMSHINEGCKAFSLTLLFISFKIGYTGR